MANVLFVDCIVEAHYSTKRINSSVTEVLNLRYYKSTYKMKKEASEKLIDMGYPPCTDISITLLRDTFKFRY